MSTTTTPAIEPYETDSDDIDPGAIVAARWQRGMTQAELGQWLDPDNPYGPHAVANWENGRRRPARFAYSRLVQFINEANEAAE
jgi:DNA-binding transcriptional regulator YiaG